MMAVVTALQMVCEAGDNVVIVSPIWPNIFQATKVVGAEPRLVRLDEDWNAGRWHLDLDKLFDACDHRTRAMFLASPGNPTGWMLTAAEQKVILDFCRMRGIAILADEVYGTLIYDGATHAPSFLSIADRRGRGLRHQQLLQALGDDRLAHRLAGASQRVEPAAAAMAQCNNTGSTHFAQYGALAALSPEGDVSAANCWRAAGPAAMWWINGSAARTGCAGSGPKAPFTASCMWMASRTVCASARTWCANDKVGVSPGWAFSLGDPRDDSYCACASPRMRRDWHRRWTGWTARSRSASPSPPPCATASRRCRAWRAWRPSRVSGSRLPAGPAPVPAWPDPARSTGAGSCRRADRPG